MMRSSHRIAVIVFLAVATFTTIDVVGQTPGGAAPTYSRDVAPILFRNCVSCHRAGEIAPMSLMTFADVRPWARAIDKQVSNGVMPPWHADAPHGTFENERGLSAAEKETISRWAAAGAPQGDPRDLPPAPVFTEGWRIGTPDVIFEMPESYSVPATGTIEYEYFYIPTNWTEAKWLEAIEVRPGNRSVVHHVLVRYQAADNAGAPPAFRTPPAQQQQPSKTTKPTHPQQNLFPSRLIATYAPGTDPQVFRPGTAVKLAAGGVIELQIHYTATGKPATDRTRVGMVLAKTAPPNELRAGQFFNMQLQIPPGAVDHRVNAEAEFVADTAIWGIFPHTHLRGKRWEYSLQLPDGSTKTLLSVPKYDFNWQTYYMFKEPVSIPKGTKLVSSAWYDNSAANRANPDPRVDVRWGDQTWEEMQYTGLIFSVR